ncbi:hypothetical protein M378DRAFT_19459 [Amanita muscaria Koide BX008]|uniref:Uncharacterized protein n=1 Tax=Amanita muscaria (strain Koide BX008) TaxID=946122 RepID=A0A0C2RUF8_AMAMK|nr:hypothetical protein M378DRAFT_19459 [Amanita muscaria Koide BX008]
MKRSALRIPPVSHLCNRLQLASSAWDWQALADSGAITQPRRDGGWCFSVPLLPAGWGADGRSLTLRVWLKIAAAALSVPIGIEASRIVKSHATGLILFE